jgi:hypothetical protein
MPPVQIANILDLHVHCDFKNHTLPSHAPNIIRVALPPQQKEQENQNETNRSSHQQIHEARTSQIQKSYNDTPNYNLISCSRETQFSLKIAPLHEQVFRNQERR